MRAEIKLPKMALGIPLRLSCCCFVLVLAALAQEESPFPAASSPPAAPASEAPADGDSGGKPGSGTSSSPAISPILPVPGATRTGSGVEWASLIRASGRFLAIEQSFRLMTEPGTRDGLKGSFVRNYARAVGNLHGWADGDEFYVNYVGHPMQGSVAGFLWVGSDTRYRAAEFGRDPLYWKSRLRAAGFAWIYSTQFEIGTFSEASIGAIQAVPPQQGFVDHVITPGAGLAWMMAEDAVDKYLIKRVEASTTNRWIRLIARSAMNPSRTFANVLQGSAPWRRETRPGIMSYRASPASSADLATLTRRWPSTEIAEATGAPPFELNVALQPERLWGAGKPTLCLGGGAAAAFRLAPSWQLVVDVGGCKLMDLGPDLSGDSLAYMAGPRWVSAGSGPWSAHWQVLVGGSKLTEERLFPEKKKLLDQLAAEGKTLPPPHDQYTEHIETSGFAVAGGGGVDFKLNRAIAIRVAELSFRHSWVAPLWGRSFNESVRFVSGFVLRMGTW